MNDRELATLIWLAVFLVVTLAFLSLCARGMLRQLVGSLLPLVLAIVLMLAWIGGLMYLGQRYGLWKPALIYDSVLWSTTAAVLFGGAVEVFNRGKSRVMVVTMDDSNLLKRLESPTIIPGAPPLLGANRAHPAVAHLWPAASSTFSFERKWLGAAGQDVTVRSGSLADVGA